MAVSELAAADAAFDKMARIAADEKGATALTDDEMMLIQEIDLLYRTREGIAIEPGTDSYPDDVAELNALDADDDATEGDGGDA